MLHAVQYSTMRFSRRCLVVLSTRIKWQLLCSELWLSPKLCLLMQVVMTTETHIVCRICIVTVA